MENMYKTMLKILLIVFLFVSCQPRYLSHYINGGIITVKHDYGDNEIEHFMFSPCLTKEIRVYVTSLSIFDIGYLHFDNTKQLNLFLEDFFQIRSECKF